MPTLVTFPQRADTAARRIRLPGAVLTALYDRSRDSRKAAAAGQDFIAFTAAEGRIAFCVCDGVSQSFYGDLAARYLGENLAAWLIDLTPPADSAAFSAALEAALAAWLPEAAEIVAHHPISANVLPMVRDALEKKRAIGSETMFVAGLIDLQGGHLYACWMGDMRLLLWDSTNQPIEVPGAAWETRERWSMLHGPRNGSPHVAIIPLGGIARITAHSDGVGPMGSVLREISLEALNHMARELADMPASDDISVLDIQLDPATVPDQPVEAVLGALAAEFATEAATETAIETAIEAATQKEPAAPAAPITFRPPLEVPPKAAAPPIPVVAPPPPSPVTPPDPDRAWAVINLLAAVLAVILSVVYVQFFR